MIKEFKIETLVDTLKAVRGRLVLDRWDCKTSSDFNPMFGDDITLEVLRVLVKRTRGRHSSFAITVTEDGKGHGLFNVDVCPALTDGLCFAGVFDTKDRFD